MSSPLKVGISGFGRIGRLVLRALYESGRTDIKVVAINDPSPLETNAHLFKYDSVHGRFPMDVSHRDGFLTVDGDDIIFSHDYKPENVGWGDKGVDIVFECSGIFRSHEQASLHIKAGAKKVLISAPGTDEDLMVVYGVNHEKLSPEHVIVSNASCTTNCLAPVAHVLHETVGIVKGFMTTIHSYTGDQQIVDTAHSDLHRARGGAINMIPTSTGAAKAVGKVLPELNGKLDGTSIRVPTPTVSVIDFTFEAARDTSVEEINKAMVDASNGALKGVLGTYDVPLVSSDFIHDPLSSVFAINETKVMGGNFVRVMSWYDNEWGFSNRMLDTAAVLAKTL